MRKKPTVSYTKELVITAVASALFSVSAMISIPFPMPFTCQVLAFYFVLFTFGGRVGLISTVIYVALGALGVPVFAGFSAGVGHILFEPGGGFILGFLASALLYFLLEAFGCGRRRVLLATLSFVTLYSTASVTILLAFTNFTWEQMSAALSMLVLPYVLPDILKMALAAFISARLKKHIKFF